MKTIASRFFTLFSGLAGAMLALPGTSAQAQQTTPILRVARPAATQVTAVETEISPPATVAAQARPGAVTLKPGSTSAVMKTLTVKRRYQIPALRTRPVIALGRGQADMTPVLRNPDSLLNIASRMRRQPGLVTVVSENAEVLEVEQGLIVRQFLTYRVKPGVCSDTARRTQLGRTGAGCFSRQAPQARKAAFADARDPRYVADPARRAQAIATAEQEAAAEQKDFASGIAEFRAMMKDPARRAQVVAEVGAGEAARLEALGDEQLEAEMVNSAETQIEEVMFMPSRDKLDDMQMTAAAGLKVPKISIPEKVDAERTLQEHVFLTGFTLGRENEWRRRVSITVKTCLVSCKKTYYVEVYAGFGYGFGLRFPIRMGGLYAYHRSGDQESASIAPVFQPIDGNPGDYSEAGLPSDKLFNGQELVAELNAYAGMNYKVPFHSGGVSANAGKDLTQGLPAPFANGQFQPPAPGGGLDKEVIFNDPDLLGGLANYGIAGAKILPAVKVGLTSDRLRLKLKDHISGVETEMTSSGQTYPLAVNPQDHSSSFSIGYPEYNLAFQVTPGLAARLFVDVAVWSHNWDWPVWFPQVAVTLPPGGMTFTCHEKTVCSRDYRYSPTVSEDKEGDVQPPEDPLEREIFNWRRAYLKKYLPQCPYLPLHFCEVAIKGVVEITGNQMFNEMSALPKYPSMEAASIMIKKAVEADNKGKAIILENKVAAVDYYGKDLFKAYEPIWSHDCADQLCRTNIHALGQPYVKALMDRQKASPQLERNEVVFLENTKGDWAGKAKREVEASRKRATPSLSPSLPRVLRPQPRVRAN